MKIISQSQKKTVTITFSAVVIVLTFLLQPIIWTIPMSQARRNDEGSPLDSAETVSNRSIRQLSDVYLRSKNRNQAI